MGTGQIYATVTYTMMGRLRLVVNKKVEMKNGLSEELV